LKKGMEEAPTISTTRVPAKPVFSWHRALEFVSVVTFAFVQAMGWLEVWRQSHGLSGILLLVLGSALGWFLSDASSGLLHFWADNYGRESWPFVGSAFIRPFREHHRDPLAILKHGFLETNGNNALIALVAFSWVPFVSSEGSRAVTLLGVTCLSWGLWTVVTNQIHAWAHASEVSAVVRVFQRLGVFLSPEQHDQHHEPPYRSHYCITSGVLDRLFRLRRSW